MSNQLVRHDELEEITDALAPYIAKSLESVMVTEYDAINFLQKMREGMLKVGEMYANAQFQESQARLYRERTEARLRLEEFPAFAATKGIVKATEKDKEAFIVLSKDYEVAYNQEMKWAAICKYLETVRSNFYSTSDDVKKSVYSRTHYNAAQVRA
jgi:hypothetical protein